MKKTKKLIAIICAVAMFAGVFSTIGFAASEDIDYEITNPYANVDWSWKQYKADLHTHTTASDGDDTLKKMIETNYDYGFDIYAVSDHGTTNYSWTEQDVIPAIKVALGLKDGMSQIETLNADGGLTFDGNRYSLVNEQGGDYYYQTYEDGTTGQRMLRVPYAIENNPTSLNNAHVNSWFVDYGHGIVGGTSDYETPIKAVDELGGLSVINHPGEYTNARDEEYTADAYDDSYSYYIDKFENLIKKYPSCIGIDINSKGDSRTRFDRKLWDIMLMDLTPEGENVLAIATSDAHRATAAYTGYTMMLMPENTVDNLKNCMSAGEFFAASKYIGNHEELQEIATYLIENGDEAAAAIGQDILARQSEDYNAKYEAPLDVDAPQVKAINVDDSEDRIAIDVEGDLCVRWISNGKTFAYGKEIDLDDYSGEIGTYVRAEIFGEGGIVYTQAMLLDYQGSPEHEAKDPTDFGFFASFIPDTIIKFLASLEIFRYIWDAIK
mgnify:CR=1 FL=1